MLHNVAGMRWWGQKGHPTSQNNSCFEVVGDEMATQQVVITCWVCIEVVGDEGVHLWGKKQHPMSCKTRWVCAEVEEGWRCGDKTTQ